MKSYEELFIISKQLAEAARPGDDDALIAPLELLDKAASEVGRSFSGSWLGYHSRVYYSDLQPPPPGANFSQEWGLKQLYGGTLGSKGNWRQFDAEDVKAKIRSMAKNPDLSQARDAADAAAAIFDNAKSDILSILETEADRPDEFLSVQKKLLEQMGPRSPVEIQQIWSPNAQIMTRDTTALGQGTEAPPHIQIMSDVKSIRNAFDICKKGSTISAKLASHLERRSKKAVEASRVGTNVFIGHGAPCCGAS